MIRIRHLAAVTGLFFAAFASAAAQTDTTDQQRPGIVLMMGDDHGWEETGYNGHPHVRTPVLDDMAASGLRFNRFYAGHSNCSPTRASFLTGRNPNRMGTYAPGWSFRPEEITMAQLLSQAGYRCGHFGKWHVGPVRGDSPVSPGAMGFQEWLSHDNFFETDPVLSRNGGPPQKIAGESSDILIDEAIRFIDAARQAEQPFLAVIWFGSPHEPYIGLPEDLARYDNLPATYAKSVSLTSVETGDQVRRPQGEVLRERYAEITAMDRAIGRLRQHLQTRGLRDNTLVFYCGDNGTPPEASLGRPHRGQKSTLYQGGLLVPGVLEWPARIPRPLSTDLAACTSDLLPTLCAATGASQPRRVLDGIDLSPAFAGQLEQRPQPLCFWEFDIRQAKIGQAEPWIEPQLQQGTTPLLKLMDGKATRDFKNFRLPDATRLQPGGTAAVIDGPWKLIVQHAGQTPPRKELFDLTRDPGESINLTDTQPAMTVKLEQQLQHWQNSVLRSLAGEDYSQ
ncbi:MAG: sulfatase [Planctomycetota bacterium]